MTGSRFIKVLKSGRGSAGAGFRDSTVITSSLVAGSSFGFSGSTGFSGLCFPFWQP